MNEIAQFKETILKDYPRFKETDRFRFSCHKHLNCYNTCCADVNIFLTPFDVLRMKNHLGISSQEFLDQYTLLPIDHNQKYPVVLLKMSESETKQCPFVNPAEGCTIYKNRPWACRMYPVGLASPKENHGEGKSAFYFILNEPQCDGFKEGVEWTIKDWIRDQEISEYNEMGELFKEIILHDKMANEVPLDPQKMEMFYMVCYNLDTFREFIFESSFLYRFEVDEETLNRIRDDDKELMKFGFQWLKFSLFGEKTFTIKDEYLQKKEAVLQK